MRSLPQMDGMDSVDFVALPVVASQIAAYFVFACQSNLVASSLSHPPVPAAADSPPDSGRVAFAVVLDRCSVEYVVAVVSSRYKAYAGLWLVAKVRAVRWPNTTWETW